MDHYKRILEKITAQTDEANAMLMKTDVVLQYDNPQPLSTHHMELTAQTVH